MSLGVWERSGRRNRLDQNVCFLGAGRGDGRRFRREVTEGADSGGLEKD